MQNEPEYRAWFESFDNPSERYPLHEVVYRSSTGSLLQVRHDLTALKCQSASDWRALFRKRSGTIEWPYASGVWKYKECVLPSVRSENIVSLHEGNTNLFWAKRLGEQLGMSELWVKLCGNSHTGSFKDLGMTVLVSYVNQMIAEGKLISAVVCASTGDTSAALAAYSAVAGIPSVVLLPRDKVSIPQLIQPLANNAIVFSLDTDFDGCMGIVQDLIQDHQLYLANSMNCLRLEGQKTLSFEIAEQFGWESPDWIIIPGGNLGNVSALAMGFDLMIELGLVNDRPRICVAQAEAANPLYQSFLTGFEEFKPVAAKPTQASAIQIGNPVSVEKAIESLRLHRGIVEQASEGELADAAAEADRTGLFNCPQTGVALAVMKKLVRRGVIQHHDRAVVVSTANGLKFPTFKSALSQDAVTSQSPHSVNSPIQITANAAMVRSRIREEIERRQETLRVLNPISTRH